MTPKKFTITLHYVSSRLPSWLYPRFNEHLHPRQQALFRVEEFVEGDCVPGTQFNLKDPIDIAEKLPSMKPGQIKVTNLGKIGYYLYLRADICHRFRDTGQKDAKIECSYENGWLKLYYKPGWRFRTLAPFFRKQAKQ